DGVEVLGQNSPHHIAGEELLLEHVHFNFQGNYLLARACAEQIQTNWPALLGLSATNSLPHLSMDECARRLAFTDWDRYQVVDEMLKRLGQPPFAQQLDHEARAERLEKARAGLQPALSGDGLARSIELYEAALRLGPADWVLHENFAKVLQSSGDPRA